MSDVPCTPIKDIANLPAEATVYKVRGTIKSIWKASSGENEHGTWSFQSLILKDATGEIKVKLKGREAMALGDKGKEIEIAAYHGDKGWSGLKTMDDDGGKPNEPLKRILLATKTADIAFIADGGRPAQQPAPAKTEQPAPQQQRPQTKQRQPDTEPEPDRELTPEEREAQKAEAEAQRKRADKKAVNNARHFYMQAGNAYLLALDAAQWIRKQAAEREKPMEFSDAETKEIATTLYIQFAREMSIQAMPDSPLPPKKKPGDTTTQPATDDEGDTGEPREKDGTYRF